MTQSGRPRALRMSFSDAGVRHTPAWRAEPNLRGSFSILSTCLVTMLLCIWTAVHLNIPQHGTKKRLFWRKAMWLAFGLLAPELVAYTAFRQLQEARIFRDQMRARLRQNHPAPILRRLSSRCWQLAVAAVKVAQQSCSSAIEHIRSLGKLQYGIHNSGDRFWSGSQRQRSGRYPWSMTHSHFALMGGFAFDTRTATVNFLPQGRKRMTLTKDGLLFLAEKRLDLFPDLSKTSIEDRSKANAWAKAIACAQAVWFCLQVITRLCQNLSISLLELNTFAHGICALLTYCMWWDKPLDVEEPVLMEGEKIHDVCSIMGLFWSFNSWHRTIFKKSSNGQDITLYARFEIDPMCLDSDRSMGEVSLLEKNLYGVARTTHGDKHLALHITHPLNPNEFVRMYPGQSLYGFCFCGYFGKTPLTFPFFDRRNPTYSLREHVDVFQSDIECMRLAFPALQRHQMLHRNLYWRKELRIGLGQEYQDFTWGNKIMLTDQIENIGGYGSSLDINLHRLAAGFSLAGLCYGSLHLLAWEAPFPTAIQQLLWRISALILTSSAGPYLIYLLGLLLRVDVPLLWVQQTVFRGPREWLACKLRSWTIESYGTKYYRWNKYWMLAGTILSTFWSPDLLVAPLGTVLAAIAGAIYLAARIYIVVACFINLAYLPDSAYETPSWSRYVPHIG